MCSVVSSWHRDRRPVPRAALNSALRDQNSEDAGRVDDGGTNIVEALQAAVDMLPAANDNRKVIVFFSDGDDMCHYLEWAGPGGTVAVEATLARRNRSARRPPRNMVHWYVDDATDIPYIVGQSCILSPHAIKRCDAFWVKIHGDATLCAIARELVIAVHTNIVCICILSLAQLHRVKRVGNVVDKHD